jgi:hypothetical protein
MLVFCKIDYFHSTIVQVQKFFIKIKTQNQI